jgi:putative transposase
MIDAQDAHRRLRRLSHTFEPCPLFFVTTCTYARRPLLAEDTAVEILTSEWRRNRDLYGWSVGSYVIMPDHVHFFCRSARDAESLSDMMRGWKQWTSKRMRRALTGCFRWQAGFFDHVLRSDESYSRKWAYVRDNPVRARLVEQAQDWPFSGHIHFR